MSTSTRRSRTKSQDLPQDENIDEQVAAEEQTEMSEPHEDTELLDQAIDDAVDDELVESEPAEAESDEAGRSRRRRGRRRKIGGVAPFVKPPGRFAQWRASRHWGRRGFVPLTPGRAKRRHRILPRTVIGIATMLMCIGIGAAFAGAGFYAYYDNRLAENERQVSRFVDGFDEQFSDASTALDDLRIDAVDQIRDELAPLGEYTTDARGVIELPTVAGPAVFAVETKDQAGRKVVGTAFGITGHNGGTALVTSLDVVRAGTAQPAPLIELIKDGDRIPVTVWAWDSEHGLALLLADVELPILDMATAGQQTGSLGGRVFAMSGVGGQGATASPGVLLDLSANGLQHTAAVGTFFEGGPLLNGSGQIVGVAIVDYRPNGIDSGTVAQSPDINAICSRILRCASSADVVVVEVADEGD